ncbi:MAG: hypothetical protein ACREID_05700 [Planctomycetota bacterium]
MRKLALALLLLPACKAPPKASQGSVTVDMDPQYEKFRPVAVVVMPADAPKSGIRKPLREEVYRRLFAKRYSPLNLIVVDNQLKGGGSWNPQDIEWDARLELDVKGWRPVEGGSRVAATGAARMVYRTGEKIWQVSFEDYPFDCEEAGGGDRDAIAAVHLAKLIVDRLPERPPPPKE